MFCTSCGARIKDTVKFCPFCGAKVMETQPPVTSAPARAIAQQLPKADDSVYAPVDDGAPAEKVAPVSDDFGTVIVEEAAAPEAEEMRTSFFEESAPAEDEGRTVIVEDIAEPEAQEMRTSFFEESVPAEDEGRTSIVEEAEVQTEPARTSFYEDPASIEVESRTVVMDGNAFTGDMPSMSAPVQNAPAQNYEVHNPTPYPYAAQNYAVQNPTRQGYPSRNPAQPQYPYQQAAPRPEQPYRDSFQQGAVYGQPNDAYAAPAKQYPKTSAGKCVGSIALCIVMFLFTVLSTTIATVRYSLSVDHINDAFSKGTVADLMFSVDGKEQSLSEYITDNAVYKDTNLPIELDKNYVNNYLKDPALNTLIRNIACGLAQYYVFGEKSLILNSNVLIPSIEALRPNIAGIAGYKVSDTDMENLKNDINGGSLSFLSVSATDEYFVSRYGFSPGLIPMAFSLWLLIAFGAVALICLGAIFIINRKNPIAGLCFNGVTLLIFGALEFLVGIGLFILSLIIKIYVVTDILRYFALGMGVIGGGALIIAIIMLVVRHFLVKKTKNGLKGV